ncbi:MAG: DUF2325 domain-containing protein [Gallionella sp.]|nr:DUF2325 domain-containing protein [Gallionella sp.]
MPVSPKDFESLVREHRVLVMQYGQVQARCSELVRAQAGEIERLQAQVMRLRAAAIVRDTALAWRAPAAGPVVRADLREKAVLCIGQDGSGASVAQQVVEMAGGHFLHHDGGDGEDGAALEASLVAADLVICQTGCVSHGAYWRVQDHCKRTGKQCVMVEQPAARTVMRIHTVTITSQDCEQSDSAQMDRMKN